MSFERGSSWSAPIIWNASPTLLFAGGSSFDQCTWPPSRSTTDIPKQKPMIHLGQNAGHYSEHDKHAIIIGL